MQLVQKVTSTEGPIEVVSSGRLISLGIPSVMAGEEAVVQEEAQLYNTTGIMENIKAK